MKSHPGRGPSPGGSTLVTSTCPLSLGSDSPCAAPVMGPGNRVRGVSLLERVKVLQPTPHCMGGTEAQQGPCFAQGHLLVGLTCR